ncbi:MAG TPA: DUF4157 domain-containing protein, partial [Kofleriaceae bacterium]|nr:DUF4157 domain-containing protein [Kofleriaceae bacterium]
MLTETRATLAARLADLATDARASRRAGQDHAAIERELADIATVLACAKEPRAMPAVSGEESIEPSILGRSAAADDVLAWVAGLGTGERRALAERVRRVQGTADRKDGFAVGLSNYLASARITSQFFGVVENPRRLDRAAYLKTRADATASAGAQTAAQGAQGHAATPAIGDQALPTPRMQEAKREESSRTGAAVQRMASGEATPLATAPDAIAQRGLDGAGGPLPHLAQIQASFGRHDVSAVQAHQGPGARDATRALGAQAYAFGNSVAFGSSPDLHTAAHEAAHVVQQRGGVQLEGGMDQPGDAHERHADAVADAVVAGKSAELLLD